MLVWRAFVLAIKDGVFCLETLIKLRTHTCIGIYMGDDEETQRITVLGALMILTLRLKIEDDTDETGVVKEHYISKEEAQRRIDILKTYPPNARYSGKVFQEIFTEG